jgi:hypothetical protein
VDKLGTEGTTRGPMRIFACCIFHFYFNYLKKCACGDTAEISAMCRLADGLDITGFGLPVLNFNPLLFVTHMVGLISKEVSAEKECETQQHGEDLAKLAGDLEIRDL